MRRGGNPRLRWQGERGNAAIVCDGCGFTLADDGQVEDWHDDSATVEAGAINQALLKSQRVAVDRRSSNAGHPDVQESPKGKEEGAEAKRFI